MSRKKHVGKKKDRAESKPTKGAPFATLQGVLPNPLAGFQPLNDFQLHRTLQLVMRFLGKICTERGIQLDLGYWKQRTRDILSTQNPGEALVIPARAGAGKSTWLLAFVLALCELHLSGDPLASALGGAVLVLQKVESLNEIVSAVEKHFPSLAEAPVVALQGWSESGQRRGFCQNAQATSYEDCGKASCPFASNCDILRFGQQAEHAYIVGMTQARFQLLRQANALTPFLSRTPENGEAPIHRRFLIFDEKFEFAQTLSLNTQLIDQASSELEELIRTRNVSDRAIGLTQTNFSVWVRAPFQRLRKQLVIEREGYVEDMPFGICTLKTEDPEVREGYQRFRVSFSKSRRRYLTPALNDCLLAMDALYKEECLFVKYGGFTVLVVANHSLQYHATQTILFDATSEVDGDYLYLKHIRFLPTSKALHMRKVTFHIYSHPDLNVSKQAMQKSWKLPAFAALVEQLAPQIEGQIFLCTYKAFAEHLLSLLPKDVRGRMAIMPERDTACLPYFGGNNGANQFNQCSTVILLGYPRLSPQTYLQRAYAAWGWHGVRGEIERAVDHLEFIEQSNGFMFSELPSLYRYQSLHLAARLEQEIYRCALRNPVCEDAINIFLFCPPEGVTDILLPRFNGCQVHEYDQLPNCVALQKDSARSYMGKPTAYSKLAAFLATWDGTRIHTSTLRQQLEISSSAWKDLMKSERCNRLLNSHNISKIGRGPHASFQKEETMEAS